MIEFISEKPTIMMTLDGGVSVTLIAPKEKLQVLSELKENKKYDIKITEHHNIRSGEANRYMWKLCTEIANVLRASKDEIYLTMLKRYGQSKMFSALSNIDVTGYFDYYETKGNSTLVVDGVEKEFTHYLVIKGSHEYDSKEMSIFIDGVVDEAQALGIDTRTPEEIAKMKYWWGK